MATETNEQPSRMKRAVASVFHFLRPAAEPRPPLEALRAALSDAGAEREKRLLDKQAAQRRQDEATAAYASGSADAERMMTEASRGQDEAEKALREIDRVVESLDRQIIVEQTRLARESDSRRRRELAVEIEAAQQEADGLQAAMVEVGARHRGLRGRLERVAALSGAARPHALDAKHHEEVASAMAGHLHALTDGAVGLEDWETKYSSAADFLRRDPDVAARVRRQCEQLLAQQPKDDDGHEPAAA